MQRNLPALTVNELTLALGSSKRANETLKWLAQQRPFPPALPSRIDTVSHRVWTPFIERCSLTSPRITERMQSEDGTLKLALSFDGTTVETVLIPAKTRSTVCISSQAGCTRKCVFCATKELGFIRQLKAEEMVAQYMVARAEAPAAQPPSNVVFMGMGEPFDNLDEVLRAVECLTQGPFPQLRAEAVTVSTSGVVPGMKRFLSESRASLALSLNATTDEQRMQIMPQTKSWPIASLIEVLREDAHKRPKRSTLVEYVLFDQFNDTLEDARRLAELCRGFSARVNLIPYNPFPGTTLKTPPKERIVAFFEALVSFGQLCIVRWPRGREIAAACGQLVLAQSGQGFSPERAKAEPN